MKFNSFISILFGVNLVGISIGSVIGYYFNERFNDYYWLYLSVPILTLGSLLVLYGSIYKK